MNKKGFTLIELLIVTAIIAVITAIVFVALNPLERFQEARNAQRWQDVRAITDSIRLYQIDNNGQIPTGIDENWRMLGTDNSGCDIHCGSDGEITYSSTSARIIISRDDAEELNPPNGTVSLISSDLELVDDGSNLQEVGMRFQSINIPSGVTISNAYIEFTVDEPNSQATNLVFYGEDIDNALIFSDIAGNITSRTKTTANTSWNSISPWVTPGTTHQTPNLSNIVQEIIDRPGWSIGNSIVIIVTGSGERTAESYNGSSTSAPLLVINYNTTSGGGEILESSCLDLSSDLSQKLNVIPQDSKNGSAEKTYYAIRKQTAGQIDVMSCSAENDKIIKVSK